MLILLLLIGLFIYLLPCVIAYNRRHNLFATLLVLNIFFGWTFVGWVICLAWSLSPNVKDAPPSL